MTKQEEAKLNFMYGNVWKDNPAIYLHAIHQDDIVRYCDCCGKPMTQSDVDDYGSLCESCYDREYND